MSIASLEEEEEQVGEQLEEEEGVEVQALEAEVVLGQELEVEVVLGQEEVEQGQVQVLAQVLELGLGLAME